MIDVLFSIAFADAAVAPIDFPIAPAFAIPKVSTCKKYLFSNSWCDLILILTK